MATVPELLAAAVAAHRQGPLPEAMAAWRAVLAAAPIPEAALNLGILCERAGDAPGAIASYQKALALRTDWPAPLANLGNLLRREGRLAEADTPLSRAAALQPGDADALGNLALLRIDQGRAAEARTLAEKATRLAPDSALWWETAGTAARLQSEATVAVEHLRRATALSPEEPGAWFELALALDEDAQDDAATEAFARAQTLDPGNLKLRWTQALRLPGFIADDAQAEQALDRWDEGIAALEHTTDLGTPGAARETLAALASVSVFNLHYLPGDHSFRQRRFSALASRITNAAIPLPPPARPPLAGRRIRVGFVSSYLRTHVVTRFFGRFITGLDPARFERHAWFTEAGGDEVTRQLQAGCDRFHAGDPGLPALAQSIHAAQLDVLVYPDIGLDARQGLLATLRLAPVQAALYGHPVSPGLEGLDAWLSGEALEPPGSEAQYLEPLVRLPGLGAAPKPPATPGDGRWADALRDGDRPLAFCLQNLLKVPPSFDAILARIARETDAVIVFFDRGAGPTARFRERLSRALAQEGVEAAHAVRIAPLRPYAEFLGGVTRADLILDTPGFSGGGTSLDALGVGAPVLCFAGASARARQTAAMLRLMGVEGLTASDDDEYLALAKALLLDRDRRDALRTLVVARAPILFEGSAACAGFMAWLERAALGTGTKDPI